MKGNLEIDEITPESAGKLAEKWMTIADADNSGTIDFGEFTVFIKKFTPD